MEDRGYQQDLIKLVKRNNALITLPTGSGKTHIAARIIQQHYLPQLRAAKASGGPFKALMFLAPTNPLVAQQCAMLRECYGINARAYHGDVTAHSFSTWRPDRWSAELSDVDVLVMTPEVLLHVLAHGAVQMCDIGLLVFDEAHHCIKDHPYAQIMEDFYHTLEPQHRPQVLGLTASPEGLLGSSKRRKRGKGAGAAAASLTADWDLQQRLDARLLTVAPELRQDMLSFVPFPANTCVQYDDTEPAWAQNAAIQQAIGRLQGAEVGLMAPAKRCEVLLCQLRRQAMLAEAGQLQLQHEGGNAASAAAVAADLAWFAGIDDSICNASMAALDKQVRGACACLELLGPWPAAAAAHLDLLSGMEGSESDDDGGGCTDEDDRVPAAVRQLQVEGQDEPEEEGQAAGAGFAAGGLVDLEVAKLMSEDDIGKAPSEMMAALRSNLQSVLSWMLSTSQQYPAIIASSELLQAAGAPGDSSVQAWSTEQLAAAAPALLALVGKSALLLALSVLSELLMHGRPQQQLHLLQEAGLQDAAATTNNHRQRQKGLLQQYSAQLLAQVPVDTLQAQVWPNLPASQAAPPWTGPPLLSPKVVTLLHLLAEKKAESGLPDVAEQQQAPPDWWSAIVFVERKLSALVLSKLLQSCPDMRSVLRAEHLIGDTERRGGSSALSMNNRAQFAVVGRFRTGELNVLLATNIGSEGMDFQKCELVVAFEPPTNVTGYIQARGRARKRGSKYCWLLPKSSPTIWGKRREISVEEKREELVCEAQDQEQLAASISAATRALLQANRAALLPHLSSTVLQPDPHHCLHTPAGAKATMRLGQPLLAGYCAKLPGCDRWGPWARGC